MATQASFFTCPKEIVLDILLRLPTWSVVQLASVNKSLVNSYEKQKGYYQQLTSKIYKLSIQGNINYFIN
jgi:hypothetical protein